MELLKANDLMTNEYRSNSNLLLLTTLLLLMMIYSNGLKLPAIICGNFTETGLK